MGVPAFQRRTAAAEVRDVGLASMLLPACCFLNGEQVVSTHPGHAEKWQAFLSRAVLRL